MNQCVLKKKTNNKEKNSKQQQKKQVTENIVRACQNKGTRWSVLLKGVRCVD